MQAGGAQDHQEQYAVTAACEGLWCSCTSRLVGARLKGSNNVMFNYYQQLKEQLRHNPKEMYKLYVITCGFLSSGHSQALLSDYIPDA